MIYIFEDRFERRKNNQSTINKYSDIVEYKKFEIESQQNLIDYVTNKLNDAVCILFHNTYKFTSEDVSVNDIQNALKSSKAKFILFSGGIERGSINSQGEITVNADVMYENLDLFLKTFKETGEPIYEMLLWGENYSLNQRLSQQARMHIEKFLDNDLSKPMDSDGLKDLIDDINNGYGFDIAEIVKERAISSNGIITLENILSIVQSQID